MSRKERKYLLPIFKYFLEKPSSFQNSPGTPELNVVLDCEKRVTLTGELQVITSVIYEAAAGSPAVTFHTAPFGSWWGLREGKRLYRLVENDTWELIENDITGFMIVHEFDVRINVSQDKENFATLRPGQMWAISLFLHGQGCGMPDDMEVGDLYRFVFKGVEVDWWDWGDELDPAETAVVLPCFIKGRVVELRDNGGRPKLIVPAFNSVEFTIV